MFTWKKSLTNTYMYNNIRHIKFRAINVITQDWEYTDKSRPLFWYNVNQEHYKSGTLSQFTGLVSAKGEEIYGGDILKVEHDSGAFYIGRVVYDPQDLTYVIKMNEKNMVIQLCRLKNVNDRFKSFEKIGDIFKNPELISTDFKVEAICAT